MPDQQKDMNGSPSLSPSSSSSQSESVSGAHERLHRVFKSGKTLPLDWRLGQLRKLYEFMKAEEAAVLSALAADLGRPAIESTSFSLLQLYSELDHLIRNLKRLAKPKRLGRQFLSPAYQLISPKGAVAVLTPSNFPIFLAVRPVASALAAGNTVLLKPTEFAPASEQFLLKLTSVLDRDAFAVVTGDADTSKNIVNLPWDHLFFTGSPKVGKLIMAAAARHLTPVTLELGGKNPALVLPDADLLSAARSIVRARFYNCGQVCIAVDYCLVEESIYNAFLDALKDAVHERYGDDPKQSDMYGRLNARQWKTVSGLLARTRGRVVCGGEVDEAERYIAPTVVSAGLDDVLMMDEIFGPVLPVLKIKSYNEALFEITSRPHPLCLYVFSNDRAVTREIIAATRSGSVCVNDTMLQVGVPGSYLGGVGESGLGGGDGYAEGFYTFSHRRCYLHANPTTANIFHFILSKRFGESAIGKLTLETATSTTGVRGKLYAILSWCASVFVSLFDKLRQKLRKTHTPARTDDDLTEAETGIIMDSDKRKTG